MGEELRFSNVAVAGQMRSRPAVAWMLACMHPCSKLSLVELGLRSRNVEGHCSMGFSERFSGIHSLPGGLFHRRFGPSITLEQFRDRITSAIHGG